MIEYFKEEQYKNAKAQCKKVLAIYFIVLALYLVASGFIFWWYLIQPYKSPVITKIKFIQHPLTVLFLIFSFIYLGIPYKRVRRFYKMTYYLMTGIRETSTGSFFEYDETLQDKDGVDFKSLVFLEWNKYKNDFFERKVLVFDEMPFPELEQNQNVKYITQGNVLISYEIL